MLSIIADPSESYLSYQDVVVPKSDFIFYFFGKIADSCVRK